MYLQNNAVEFFEKIFLLVTKLGEEQLLTVVVLTVFWCVNKRIGYRLGFAYLFSMVINGSVKEIFGVSRPWELNESIKPPEAALEEATGFSFPSGHTQGFAALSTALVVSYRKKWLAGILIILILAVAASRMYLRVHTPLDVAVGAALGIITALIGVLIFEFFAKDREYRSLLLLVPAVAIYLFWPSADGAKALGTFSAFVIGFVIESRHIRFEVKVPVIFRIIRWVIGMAGTFAIMMGLKTVFPEADAYHFIRYFCVGIWAVIIMPLLFKFLAPKSRGLKEEQK